MNITGTPSAPKVDFNLDFPSLDADAKQMIYSLISSEEQMNQQVLYLLAVGRFYTESKEQCPSPKHQPDFSRHAKHSQWTNQPAD